MTVDPELKSVIGSALNEHFDTLKRETEKKDALNQEKLFKTEKAIGDAMEAIQATKEAIALEKKSREELEVAISRQGATSQKDEGKELDTKRAKIVEDFIRKGNGANAVELKDFFHERASALQLDAKALRVNTDPDGGYLVLPEFGGVKVGREFETSPMRAYAEVVSINTDSYEFVLDDDEASASWVAEEASRAETDTPQVRKIILATHEMYAKPKATQKMLEDGIVDVGAWLSGKINDRFNRLEATAFVTGDGVGKPRGFATYGDWTTAGTYQVNAIEEFNSTSSGNFTYDVMVETQAGLKASYQGNAIWTAPRSGLANLLQVKDGELRPIFNLDFSKDALSVGTILGKPLVFFNDMAAPAANSLSAAYGDFRQGYTVVERKGINILRDPYSSKPYVEFYATKRVGGGVSNFEAIKIVKLG